MTVSWFGSAGCILRKYFFDKRQLVGLSDGAGFTAIEAYIGGSGVCEACT